MWLDYMSKTFGGDGLEGKYGSGLLAAVAEAFGFDKRPEVLPEVVNAKVMQRCGNSGCLDKNDICCKACDIEKCRYKCDFLDKEICDHQYLK